MNLEDEIAAFVDTGVWIECDVCGRTYGGLGVEKVIVKVEQANVCAWCLQAVKSQE